MSADKYVIAMDGPAGSGKSSVARMLALELGVLHADSGAMYRLVTLSLMDQLGKGADHREFGQMVFSSSLKNLDELGCDVIFVDQRQENRYRGADVGDAIRSPVVTERIRYIADNPGYRKVVNDMLRSLASQTSLVVDGRDIGTEVFPYTPFKFYIDASIEVRARRRLGEFLQKGFTPPEMTILEREIETRDQEDLSRPVGALRRADDAIYIDTSELSLNDVLTRLMSYLQMQF